MVVFGVRIGQVLLSRNLHKAVHSISLELVPINGDIGTTELVDTTTLCVDRLSKDVLSIKIHHKRHLQVHQ